MCFTLADRWTLNFNCRRPTGRHTHTCCGTCATSCGAKKPQSEKKKNEAEREEWREREKKKRCSPSIEMLKIPPKSEQRRDLASSSFCPPREHKLHVVAKCHTAFISSAAARAARGKLPLSMRLHWPDYTAACLGSVAKVPPYPRINV